MAIEQVAQGGCVVVVVVGAQLGHRMSATEALVAVVLGNGFLAVPWTFARKEREFSWGFGLSHGGVSAV